MDFLKSTLFGVPLLSFLKWLLVLASGMAAFMGLAWGTVYLLALYMSEEAAKDAFLLGFVFVNLCVAAWAMASLWQEPR